MQRLKWVTRRLLDTLRKTSTTKRKVVIVCRFSQADPIPHLSISAIVAKADPLECGRFRLPVAKSCHSWEGVSGESRTNIDKGEATQYT